MVMENYKEIDKKAIMAYLEKFPDGVLVSDIMANAGADRMRVFPILFEYYLDKKLEVLEETELGGFVKVKLAKNESNNIELQ